MARPLFSDMLFDRRRQLGLSIKQASNVLRLKEEVLVAFEEGNFESIPKSGYAQGMLSSYARYLGLNAKTVVNQFSQDLFEYERGASSHEARRRGRHNRNSDNGPLYQTPQANAPGQGRSRRTYVESHGFLPTSGGFAGDLGEFATTSDARPRYRSSSSYDSDYTQGRPYTSRVPYAQGASTPLGQVQRQRPGTNSRAYYGPQDSYGQAGSGRHLVSAYPQAVGYYPPSYDDVTTRRVTPSQYRDDMRLDNTGGTYETASSAAGRRSSRNIANTERPNVQRRSSRRSREQLSRRDRDQASRGGIVGMVQLFFSERSRVMALIIAVLAIVLTCVIIFTVQSCVGSHQSTGRSVAVTSTDANDNSDSSETEDSSDTTVTSEEEEKARAEAAAAKAAETETPATERTIEVSVTSGEVTWLEIECDGKSDIAETVTGPWSQSYTVRQSISINVSDTTAVTVMENGKKLEFDSKASGIGTITIQVAKKSELQDQAANGQNGNGTQTIDGQTVDGQTVDGQTADGQQQSQDGTTPGEQQQDATANDPWTEGSDESSQQQSTESPYDGFALGADGYYYGAYGYYDPDGNYHSYDE